VFLSKSTAYVRGRIFEILTIIFGITSRGIVAPVRKSIGKYTRFAMAVAACAFGATLAMRKPKEKILNMERRRDKINDGPFAK